MEISDWQEAETHWKVVWKYATMECGGQCAVTFGIDQTQLSCVDNLVTPVQVHRKNNHS